MRNVRTVNNCEQRQEGSILCLDHLPVRCFDGVGQVVEVNRDVGSGVNLAATRLQEELAREEQALRTARLEQPLQQWIEECRAERRRDRRRAVGKGRENRRLHRKFRQAGRMYRRVA